MNKLYIHGDPQPTQSLFRLIGKNEDALTYALGYLLANDAQFCTDVLKTCGALPKRKGKNWANAIIPYSVHLQQRTMPAGGRRDIVIESPNEIRVVLEAKVGRALQTSEQLLKYGYASSDWERYRSGQRKVIVALAHKALSHATVDHVRGKLRSEQIELRECRWHQILAVARRHRPASDSMAFLFREFLRFFKGDYVMNCFDAEVAIQDVNPVNKRIYEKGWMYVTALRDKAEPLYFAPYFTGGGSEGGLQMLSRIYHVEERNRDKISLGDDMFDSGGSREHIKRWKVGLKLIHDRWEREKSDGKVWDEVLRLYFLGQPVPLPHRIVKGGADGLIRSNQIAKGFSLTFEQLLRRQ